MWLSGLFEPVERVLPLGEPDGRKHRRHHSTSKPNVLTGWCRSFLRLAPFSRFGSLFQSSQSRIPKPFDELDQLIEGFRSNHIKTLRSRPALIEEASLAQHAEVLRDGSSRDPELSCHGSRVHFAVANKLHDLEPSLVAQSPNLGQDGHL
jgi:hypothetical protein